MKEVLDPLTRIAGVRKALLVSEDGVPIAARDSIDAELSGRGSGPNPSTDDVDALSGLAVSLMGDLRRAIDPLTWDAPRYVVLRAAHGTLAIMQSPGSLLLVILERGLQPEDLRVPMEAAVARVQRVLRRNHSMEPAAALPGRSDSQLSTTIGNVHEPTEVPGFAGER